MQKDEMTVVMGSVTRGRKGIETLLEIFRPPWKKCVGHILQLLDNV